MARSRSPRNRSCKKGYYKPRGSKKCVKSIGLKKGRLSQFITSDKPYTSLSAEQRHVVIKKAINKYGAGSVVRMLNAPAILLKRTSPNKASKFEADKKWVQRNYLKNSPKRSSRRSRKTRSKRRSTRKSCRYGRKKSGVCKRKPGPKRSRR